MQFNLHADYVKAVAHPRTRTGDRATYEARRSQPPPRPVRALVARTLVSVAAAMDDESVQRAKAA
jgi:hypothetical protein